METSIILATYQEMNALSEKKIPFFFLIDFEQKHATLIKPEDLHKEDVQIDFPNFKSPTAEKELPAFQLQAFPESPKSYAEGFDLIQKHLNLGDSYLANYTCKTPIETNYSLNDIFLSTKAKYKVRYKDIFVCFSPETFVEIQGKHITTHPMKGTIDALIPNAETLLKENEKEKAEHFTVVDLLRNDLSMVANNVTVKEFQRIDRIKTHQGELLGMSSEINGTLRPAFQGKIGSIFQTLLPAGSILGAPKPKTMDIIIKAEKSPRGWYTGICGYFDGENTDSCVMIRFIEKDGEQYYFRSGGGITHQSHWKDEYEEMKNKIYVPIFRKH